MTTTAPGSTSFVINPTDVPEAYDIFFLAGRASPGVCKLETAGRETGWDEQKAKGQDGATTVKNGSKLVKFTVTLTLWKDGQDDHFAAYETWKAVLDTPVKAKDPKALDCYHPVLAELNVRSCVVAKRGALEPATGNMTGGATVKIEFLEFSPPKSAPSTAPDGSKNKTNPDPNADVRADVQGKTERNEALKQMRDQYNNP